MATDPFAKLKAFIHHNLPHLADSILDFKDGQPFTKGIDDKMLSLINDLRKIVPANQALPVALSMVSTAALEFCAREVK